MCNYCRFTNCNLLQIKKCIKIVSFSSIVHKGEFFFFSFLPDSVHSRPTHFAIDKLLPLKKQSLQKFKTYKQFHCCNQALRAPESGAEAPVAPAPRALDTGVLENCFTSGASVAGAREKIMRPQGLVAIHFCFDAIKIGIDTRKLN